MHVKIVFLVKNNLNSIEFLIFEALTDSYICHDEFILVNNVLKEYDEIKEERKKIKDLRLLIYL